MHIDQPDTPDPAMDREGIRLALPSSAVLTTTASAC
jgi:hypothetical protein